jgi:hypothetical protein
VLKCRVDCADKGYVGRKKTGPLKNDLSNNRKVFNTLLRRMKMKIVLTKMLMLSLMMWGCGVPEGADREETATDEELNVEEEEVSDSEFVSDEEISGETITAQIDEAVSSIAEEQDASSASALGLRSGVGKMGGKERKAGKRHRECTVDGNSAVVSIKRNFSRTFDKSGMRSITVSMANAGSRTRTWSLEDGQIGCKENGKSADVPKDDRAGVTLDVEFERSKSKSMAMINRKGEIVERSKSFSAKGERHVKFLSVTEDDEASEITVVREQTKKVTRTMHIMNKKGEERFMEHSIESKEDAPMNVTIVRDSGTHKALSRTINSGSLISESKKGGLVETSFDSVTYEPNNCFPISGTISGSITKPNEDEAFVTYTITFDGSSKLIEFSDGRSHEFSPEGCDLEAPEEIEDVTTEAEVSEVLDDTADESEDEEAAEEAATEEEESETE